MLYASFVSKGSTTMRDKFHVLIVKEDPRVAVSWQEALERAGYYVTCVGRGETALQRLENERIDVVVVDPSLSGMPSDVLAHRIREHSPQLPVMLLAGTALASYPELLEDPHVLLLSKPANARSLKKYLGQLFQERVAPLWQVRAGRARIPCFERSTQTSQRCARVFCPQAPRFSATPAPA
jgi:CheY-like chemotaxis protein